MITALLVSVNYSDYLEIALPYNTKQFDEIIVLTIESDKSCQEICSKYSNVKCLVFPDEILKKNGKTFNKGALINKGFEYLNEIGYSDWLVMTDSDIVFPENFKELMDSKEKDPNILYGMSRKHCDNTQILDTYMKTKDDNMMRVEAYELPFIGFCQIFFYKVNKFSFVEDYNAEMCDIIFLTHFSENFKRFMNSDPLPTMGYRRYVRAGSEFSWLTKREFVVHLGPPKTNWKGRITPQFV